MSDTSSPPDLAKEELVMEHLVSLTYRERLTPNLNRFVDRLMEGHLVGHKCPSCGRVYVPSKGYCPLCVVATTEADEVELADTGTVTGFTIITPVAYYGQEATEPFVYASVLLDGADTALSASPTPNCAAACGSRPCGNRSRSARPRGSATGAGVASAPSSSPSRPPASPTLPRTSTRTTSSDARP
jgi:uncharacterized OB-fold protein